MQTFGPRRRMVGLLPSSSTTPRDRGPEPCQSYEVDEHGHVKNPGCTTPRSLILASGNPEAQSDGESEAHIRARNDRPDYGSYECACEVDKESRPKRATSDK